MSNGHEAPAAGVHLLAERLKATLIEVATAVRQFWEGCLRSPTGC